MKCLWVALPVVGTGVAEVGGAEPLAACLYFLLCASGVVGMVVGARRDQARAAAWWCLAAGYATWVLGDVVLLLAPQVRAAAGTHVAAAPYLAAYLPLGAGLVMLARSAGARSWRGAVLESSLFAIALTLFSCVLVIRPVLARGTTSGAGEDALSVAYLVCDTVLVALAVHLLAGSARRAPGHVLGAAGLVLVMLCDGAWVVLGRDGDHQALLALGGLVSNLLWGAAALRAGRTDALDRTDDGPGAPAHLSRRRLLVLAGALALPSALLAVLALQSHRRVPARGWPMGWELWAVVVAGALMAVLVVLRMAEAVRAVRASVEELARMSVVLERQATRDALTGLVNRARSRAQLADSLRSARRSGRSLGLLFVDLDGFKAVNDTHGHRVGDDVLRTVAGRLTSCVQSTDVVGRLGGDEFVVILTRVEDEAGLLVVAERVVTHLSAAMTSAGQPVSIGASVGAVFSRDGDTDHDVLLHEADTAVYRAKSTGRGRVAVFDDRMRREIAAQAELELQLRDAISTDELELHYQPVVELTSGAVTGVEALVRWRRADRGLIGPGDFIPVAEASDLVCDLGLWVLHAALRQQARWASSSPGGVGPVVGVNMAPRHLAQLRIVDDIAAALAEHGVRPDRLVVEVTETELVDAAVTVAHLRQIRELGVRVAIDDFGTGWTSIAQLQRLPCDVLKIDRSLVVSTDPGAVELLSLAVSAGRAFGMSVVAEGVETAEQGAAALAAGAHFGQGWLWSRALPPAELDDVMRAAGPQGSSRAAAPVV